MGGCLSPRMIIDDTSRPVFHVWNINEDGHYIKSCHIQVTETDLVLHQRGEPPIVWPLHSLRRYGFDTELFSFECGRRCTTGPGIFAFKCKEAESLFNALQECLLVPRSSESEAASGNGEETEQPSSLGGDVESALGSDLLLKDGGEKFEPQPGPSTVINGHPVMSREVIPSAPVVTPSLPPTPVAKHRYSEQLEVLYDDIKGLPPLGFYDSGTKFLPRCCTVGTCVSAYKQYYLNNEVLRKTTCGSCRTCSLNMCVVKKSTGSVSYSERARQADYGKVLDPGGHPRNSVHCCCDFKPTQQKMGCSADNCPLHFNNCVDQITNYARLDSLHKHEQAEKATLRKEKLYQFQQPYSHLYTHIPTPLSKWPKTKSMSWRSLPHFGAVSSFSHLVPKRSTSHFYANLADSSKEKYFFTTTKSHAVTEPEQKTSYLKLDLEQKAGSSGSLPVMSSASDSPEKSEPDTYAKIDFDKTSALANISNQAMLDEDGARMTRHSATKMSSAGTQT